MPPAPSPRLPPRLRPSRFEDVAQIQTLEAAHGMETHPADDWRGAISSTVSSSACASAEIALSSPISQP